MPQVHRVADIDDESSALWLEAVTHDESPWTVDRYRDAATMLGRFAACAAVSEVDQSLTNQHGPQQARVYFETGSADSSSPRTSRARCGTIRPSLRMSTTSSDHD